MASSDAIPTTVARLTLAWATTLAVLLAVTWPLWTPLREVPRLGPFGAPPAFVEIALLAAAGWGLLTTCFRSGGRRRGILVTIAALFLLMAFDQLRWQPWAYHALLVGTALATNNARRTVGVLRGVTIAVYAFSAIAKLDAEFVATLGRQMVGVLLKPIGMDPAAFGDPTIGALALSLPIAELTLALLLAVAGRWNHVAKPVCVLVVVMHAVTIAVLSPWGLDHSLGVLLWNAGFAWQTIVLFGSPLPEAEESTTASPFTQISQAAVVLLGVGAPLGTPFGLWDQWPGWALYAPGGERATLFVHNAAVDRLPESMRPYVKPEDDSPWRAVRLNDWVLEATGAPIYPENRIVAAVAVGLLERYPLTDRVRVVSESAADRLSRERQLVELTTREEIETAAAMAGKTPAVVWNR